MGKSHLEVEVAPLSVRFDPDDESWSLQCDDLRRELIASVPGARRVDIAQVGTKGTAESVIVALGGAGAISAMVSCFQLWLDRDRSRQIKVTWTRNGIEESLIVTGDGMSAAVLEKLADAVARRIGS
ncbi:hypothetical protein Raf01_43130 [Rugosimonospora africana]|uniref:Uncharacterized protein n=1 Tax=Rugosimonospora africana TaxID=556532 RepID=A0A8J3QTE5_9ACTN|nr:hypothetical protein Raf01_43130 [Rugosimonospora africana]